MFINYLRSNLRRIIKGQPQFLSDRGYQLTDEGTKASEQAIKSAKMIRGEKCPPSVILHGVTPRSGTTYIGNILGLHPEIYKYPHEIFEFPLLKLVEDITDLHENFIVSYSNNRGKIKDNDIMMLFGSSMIAYLYSFVPRHKRMFLKVPNVEFLNYFYTMFPFENLFVLMRDGRDVVSSALKTWPNLGFSDACRWWDNSAREVLFCNELYSSNQGYYYARYEDIFNDPTTMVKDICKRFNLNIDQYPFEKINEIPIVGSSVIRKQKKVDWIPMEKPADFNPIGRWHDWSRLQKKIFKQIAGESLLALEYCDNLNW